MPEKERPHGFSVFRKHRAAGRLPLSMKGLLCRFFRMPEPAGNRSFSDGTAGRADREAAGALGIYAGNAAGQGLVSVSVRCRTVEEFAERFLENEKVAPSVRELLMEAAQCQKAVLDQEKAGTTPAALYIHIPFCPSHCAYCSFPAAIVRRGEALDSFTASLCEDIRRAGALSRRKHFVIESIYFGGGRRPFSRRLRWSAFLMR